MSQPNCTPLCQIDARLWVSIFSENIGDLSTPKIIPHSKPGKFYRSGIRWISDYTYITMYDMIVGGRLSKPSERSFVERSVIVQHPDIKDPKNYSKKLLDNRANSC